jgi:hypothetical protein
MKDTEKTPLFTELTTEESATVNGAHGYYRPYYGRPCGYAPVAYYSPRYYRHRPSVNVGVTVSY